MSTRHLKRTSHKIGHRTDVWWYEEVQGICLIHEPTPITTTTNIAWRALRGALARKDRPDEIRGKAKK